MTELWRGVQILCCRCFSYGTEAGVRAWFFRGGIKCGRKCGVQGPVLKSHVGHQVPGGSLAAPGTLPPTCNLQTGPCQPQPINQISHLPCSPFPKDNARAFFPLRWQFPPTSLAGSLHISDMALTGRDELNAYGVVLNGGCT